MELPPHDLTGALASPFYGGPWAFVTARAGRTPVASAAVPQEAPAPGTPFYGRRPGWVPRFPQKSKKDANFPLAFSREPCYTKQSFRRYSSSVERKLPKLDRRVRLPLPAPKKKDIRSDVLLFLVLAAGGGLRPKAHFPWGTYRALPSGPASRATWPSSMRYSRWARASPVANHFWFRGKASQLSALMSQVIRLATW